MKGRLPFVPSFKESMGYLPTQKILKGISSEDVNVYLRWLSARYETSGRTITYIWKRVKKLNNLSQRTFDGFSVYSLLSSTPGQYVLFGKAKWANTKYHTQLRTIRGLKGDRLKFLYFGSYADGSKVPDHAVGLVVSPESDNLLYDNSMRDISLIFSAVALATKLQDVSSCFIFDVRLSN